MASGDNMDVVVVNPLAARPEQRSMPSSAWLMPYEGFWKDDEVLIYAPHYNYTVKDYRSFFQDVGFPNGYSMRQDTYSLINQLTPPGVEVFCIHGVNVPTPESFVYDERTWYNQQPDVINGDGDGTVNLRSAEGCVRWSEQQEQPVHSQAFKGAEHVGMLRRDDVIDYIKQSLLGVHRHTYGQDFLMS